MTTYYTSKKNGVTYELEGSHVIEGKTRFTLYSEAEQDRISVTESVLKRWYKKTVEVDFTDAEKKPEADKNLVPMPGSDKLADLANEYNKPESPKAKKSSKKQSKPRAKTYEEQNWGLGHTRISSETFCSTMDLTSIEYDEKSQTITLLSGAEPVARRRAWQNEITGSVWFRFHNYEYELTDVEYVTLEAEGDVA